MSNVPNFENEYIKKNRQKYLHGKIQVHSSEADSTDIWL